MKRLVIAFAFTTFGIISVTSQTTFDLPQNIELKVESDYAKYENDVISAAKWLEATDLNKDIDKRKEVDVFVFKWISGTPDITVEMNELLTKLYDKNNELLFLYMASYSRHLLESKNATQTDAVKVGIISMINVYKKGIAITKNKEMEKAIKAFDQDKLEEYIGKNFK